MAVPVLHFAFMTGCDACAAVAPIVRQYARSGGSARIALHNVLDGLPFPLSRTPTFDLQFGNALVAKWELQSTTELPDARTLQAWVDSNLARWRSR